MKFSTGNIKFEIHFMETDFFFFFLLIKKTKKKLITNFLCEMIGHIEVLNKI